MKRFSTETLQDYIAEARYEEALIFLLSETKNTPFYKESVRLSSNYNDLKGKWLQGVISQSDYNLILNQWIKRIYEHISKIEQNHGKVICQSKYRKLFATVTVCGLLISVALYVFVSVLNKGSFIFDKRDWTIYRIQKTANFEYMVDNLILDLKDSLSWCYEGKTRNCKNFGRLYNLEGAKNACAELGNGWRLPTKEEVNEIIGPLPIKTNVKGMLGGERSANGEFLYLGEAGLYWTMSKSDDKYVWIMYVYGSKGVIDWVDVGDKRHGFSCRCVRSLN